MVGGWGGKGGEKKKGGGGLKMGRRCMRGGRMIVTQIGPSTKGRSHRNVRRGSGRPGKSTMLLTGTLAGQRSAP